MPAYTRLPSEQAKFYSPAGKGGTNLRLPIDQIPTGQYSLIKNLRQYVDGSWTLRPGLTLVSNSFGAASYLHSLLRYNDSNPDTNVSWARFVGADTDLYVGQDDADFSAAWNPVLTGLSGDPLSLIPFRADAAPNSSVYVGDKNMMRSVVFRPQDDLTSGPTVYQVGIPPPNDAITPASNGAGVLNGKYWWCFVARNRYTGARSNPSNPTRIDMTSDPVLPGVGGGLALSNEQALMSLPTHGGGGSTYTSDFIFDVYRFGGTVFAWHLVGSADAAAGSFADNLPDTAVLSAPGFPVDANGAPALIQPFPTADIYRTGSCGLSQPGGAGTPTLLTLSSGAPPAGIWENYPPGTRIVLNGQNSYTFYRFPHSASVVELTEDAFTQIGAGPFTWEILSGATVVGQPLPHLWGPFAAPNLFTGGAAGGLFIFGCGDPRNPGTLYWTNGNDPDSSAGTNSLEITEPGEPLVNGMLYDGRCYVWSTKQMFEVVADYSNPGQFLVRKIPNAGGLYAPWGLADCGAFMAYTGYDGIFKSQGVGSESLTDDFLYPLFTHDGNPGTDMTRGGEHLYPPDPNALHKWRLAWQYGELYFDYPEVTSGKNKCWVRGTRTGTDRGWVLDDYNFDGATSRATELTPVASAPRVGVSDFLIGIGGSLYTFTGLGDATFGIPIVLETPVWDKGDPRAAAWWGDGQLEYNVNDSTGSAKFTLTLLGDPINGGQPTSFPAGPGFTNAISIPNNSGVRSFLVVSPNQNNRTLGIRITGTVLPNGTTIGQPEFFSWQPSWIAKPETTGSRIDDWSDDGKPGNKLVRGCVIEGDTASAAGTDLVVDGANPLKVASASYGAFAAGDVGKHLAVLSGTNWIPDTYVIVSVAAGAATLDHSPAPIGTAAGTWALGVAKSVQIQSDGGAVQATIAVSHPGQSEFPYFWAPFESHEMRIAPVDTTAWREFRVRWIYDDYPEFGTQVEDYQKLPKPQYIRGFELEVSTKGQPVSFQIQTDLGNVVATPSVNTAVRDILFYALSSPVIASEFRLVPLGPWEKFNLRLVADEYPDFGALISAWIAPAGGKPAFVRGINIRGDTQNVAINVAVYTEGGSLAFTISGVKLSGQTVQNYPVPVPFVTHLLQLRPNGNWRFWDATFDAEEYPELTSEYSAVLTPFGGGAAYVREAVIQVDTQSLPQTLDILGDGALAVVSGIAVAGNGKQGNPVAFNPPFIAHTIMFRPKGLMRLWAQDVKWIFDPYPELVAGQTSIRKLGGCRLVQGVRLVADTGNVAVAFKIYGDGGVLQVTTPATVFNGKQMIAFPRTNEWTPFFGHEVYIVPQGAARIWEDETEWISEPAPDIGTGWITPPVTAGFKTWWQERFIWLGYLSTAPVACAVTLDGGVIESYAFPSSGGSYLRTYAPCSPSKSKYRSYAISSPAPFRLYLQDSFILAKEFVSPSGIFPTSFQPIHVFGDASLESGARI